MKVNDALIEKYTIRKSRVENRPGQWSSTLVEILMDGEKIGEYKYNYHSGAPFHPFEQGGKHYALYSRDYTATRVMSLPDCKDLGGEAPGAFGFCPTGYAVPFETYSIHDNMTDSDPKPPNPRWQPKVWAETIQKEKHVEYEWPKAGHPKYEAFTAACAEFDRLVKEWDARHPWVERSLDGQFGFICGCVWGDDSSWKIEYLDLSRVSEGIIVRDARMGYIELLDGADGLADAIDVSSWEPDDRRVRISCAKSFDLAKQASEG